MKNATSGTTRRQFVLFATSAVTVTLAGCLDDDEDDEIPGDEDLLPSDQQALVEAWIAAVDDDLDVQSWRMFGDQFIPEYSSGNPPETDIPILGESYADIVADGFEYETMPTAVDDEGLIQYMVYIYPEWAEEYYQGEIDKDEYIGRIEGTIH